MAHMGESKKNLPIWGRKLRWLWFVIAVIGILQTPGAVISAIRLASSDHRLVFIPFIALPIRFGMIFLFLWLWWTYRPQKEKEGD